MAARSFSYGENLWAKNQKSATFQLLRYAQTGDPLALQRHDAAMDIHQHFRKGHAAAVGAPYQSAIVLEEFSKAGMPPEDIEKAAWLHQTFRHTEMVRKILSLWSEGEAVMARLEPLRAELAAYYQQNRDDSRRLAEIAAEIDEIDRSLEPKEFEFSLTLGAMAHRVYGLLPVSYTHLDQDELMTAFERSELRRDFVAVVRYQGPRANGMPELHKLTPPLGVLQDAGFKVALVTDGRMSGASGKVPAAIHVTPECLAGGPLAKVRNGDVIRLDGERGVLEVRAAESEWAARQPETLDLSHYQHGLGRELFAGFRANAAEAEQGGITFQSTEKATGTAG